MPLGIVGKKIGMTRVFTEDGASVPVTVVHVENNRVAQLKFQLRYAVVLYVHYRDWH